MRYFQIAEDDKRPTAANNCPIAANNCPIKDEQKWSKNKRNSLNFMGDKGNFIVKKSIKFTEYLTLKNGAILVNIKNNVLICHNRRFLYK